MWGVNTRFGERFRGLLILHVSGKGSPPERGRSYRPRPPTHWQLCRAVKMVNQTLGALSLEKHPDKTFIGKIEPGFDFLGYHFSPAG